MIDLHCDTLMLCTLKKSHALRDNSGCVSLRKLKKGGALAQCFAVYIPTGEDAREAGLHCGPYEYYLRALSVYRRELGENADLIRPALSAEDILRNRDAGLLSAVLTVEDAVLLEGKLSRIDELYSHGVRMMSLCWNYENELSYPNSDEASIMSRGLKPFGIECVQRMNELGMAVDVSHLSEGGFWDVAEYSKKPFAASHSCAAALCPHRRNLSDSQLRALADKGGVVGVNFYPAFLSPDSDGSIERVLWHMRHIRRVAGTEVLALGSDFDGFDGETELDGSDKLPLLREALQREFGTAEAEKFCSGNALRFFRDCFHP